jgi:hypothetical protein
MGASIAAQAESPKALLKSPQRIAERGRPVSANGLARLADLAGARSCVRARTGFAFVEAARHLLQTQHVEVAQRLPFGDAARPWDVPADEPHFASPVERASTRCSLRSNPRACCLTHVRCVVLSF